MINRSLGVLIAGVVLVCGGLGSQDVQAEPAVVIDDFGCGGFVPNADTPTGLPALANLITFEQTHSVTTKSGVTILTCHFDHAVDLPHATAGRGFLCGTSLGLTDDTQMFASPGGKAILVCKINGKDK